MKLSAPKQGTFIIGVFLLILAIVIRFLNTGVSVQAFWVAIASAIVLTLGICCKGF